MVVYGYFLEMIHLVIRQMFAKDLLHVKPRSKLRRDQENYAARWHPEV